MKSAPWIALGLLVIAISVAPSAAAAKVRLGCHLGGNYELDGYALESGAEPRGGCPPALPGGCTTTFALAEAGATLNLVNHLWYQPTSPSTVYNGTTDFADASSDHAGAFVKCTL